jgi:hypothetical protein
MARKSTDECRALSVGLRRPIHVDEDTSEVIEKVETPF